MTLLRMLAAVLAGALILGAGRVQAEMKGEWIEYSHGDVKLKAYFMQLSSKPSDLQPRSMAIDVSLHSSAASGA